MKQLQPEDFDTFKKLGSYEGPSYQLSALVGGVLKGMLCEIVRAVSQNCEMITKDGWDYSDTGYEFRNGFECASWLENASRQEILFGPEINVRHEVCAAIETVLNDPKNELGRWLVLAWYWHDLEHDHDNDQKTMLVTELTTDEVSRCSSCFRRRQRQPSSNSAACWRTADAGDEERTLNVQDVTYW